MYTPRCLDAAAWTAARDVVVAGVRACGPRSSVHATCLLSETCRFLAKTSPAAWDRVSAPDLDVLLTDEAIMAATAKGPKRQANSRVTTRQHLREVSRAVTGTARVLLATHSGASKASREFWPSTAGVGPFSVLAAAYRERGGVICQQTWKGILDELLVDLSQLGDVNDQTIVIAKTTANNGVRGIVPDVQACAAALRDAPDVTIEVSAVTAPSSSARAGSTSARPMSKTTRLRLGRQALAAKAAAVEAAANPAPPQVADIPEVAADIAQVIAAYRPLSVTADDWQRICEATRIAMTAYRPSTAKDASSKGSWIAKYCAWLLHRPERLVETHDLQVTELLDADLVEHYFGVTLADQPKASRATARAILRRVVANLNVAGRPEKLPYQAVQPPYTLIECDELRHLARTQPTPTQRRALSAAVALCLGAGLSAEESKAITPTQVRTLTLGDHGTAVVVDVLGRNARTAIVRAEYADLLLDAVAIHHRQRRGADMPLYGRDPERRASVSRVATNARTASGKGIDANGARMRSTWLVAVMSAPVPLGAVLAASGLRTARTMADLVPYCPPPDPDQVAAVLAGLADVEPRESA